MPAVRSMPALLVTLLATTACGNDATSEVAQAANSAAVQDADASDTPSQTSSCFLRGATPEEAAARPSPLGEVVIPMGEESAKLCYGRPSARERVVMGELVPLGAPWRMGANEATALHLPFAAEVGGIALEPGSYSIFGIPGEEEWEIFINGTAERWGVPISEEVRATDVGSFTRPAATIDESVETLTYRWESHGQDMGHIVMEWENTRVEIPVHGASMM